MTWTATQDHGGFEIPVSHLPAPKKVVKPLTKRGGRKKGGRNLHAEFDADSPSDIDHYFIQDHIRAAALKVARFLPY